MYLRILKNQHVYVVVSLQEIKIQFDGFFSSKNLSEFVKDRLCLLPII